MHCFVSLISKRATACMTNITTVIVSLDQWPLEHCVESIRGIRVFQYARSSCKLLLSSISGSIPTDLGAPFPSSESEGAGSRLQSAFIGHPARFLAESQNSSGQVEWKKKDTESQQKRKYSNKRTNLKP